MILEKSLSTVRMSTWLKLTGVLVLVIGLAFFNGAGGGSVAQGPNKQLTLNKLGAPEKPEDPLVKLLLAVMKKRPIRLRLDIAVEPSGLPASFEIMDPVVEPAKFDELAKFLRGLPKADEPPEGVLGGFMIYNDNASCWVQVNSGIIEIRVAPSSIKSLKNLWAATTGAGEEKRAYYKDIHGLEKWLEEQYEQSWLKFGSLEFLKRREKWPRIWVSVGARSGLPDPSFIIRDPAKIDELAKFFEGLPKIITEPGKGIWSTFPQQQGGVGPFSIFNDALDFRIPPYAVVLNRGFIEKLERVDGNDVLVYYKDIHGLYKWLEELWEQEIEKWENEWEEWENEQSILDQPSALNSSASASERSKEELTVVRKECPWPEWPSIWVAWDISSGRLDPSFWISGHTKFDEFLKFFEDLPETGQPAWVHGPSGGFTLLYISPHPSVPVPWVRVASGVIEMLESKGYRYYKDIHGLEKWLEEQAKESLNCNQSSAPSDAEESPSHPEHESTSLQLPLSGAEPPYKPELWNRPVYPEAELERYHDGRATIDDRWAIIRYFNLSDVLTGIQHKNNCYNYADNIVTDTIPDGAQPGKRAGREVPKAYFVEDGKKIDGTRGDHTLAELCEEVKKAALEDGKVVDHRVPGLKAWDCTRKCEGGYYKEALGATMTHPLVQIMTGTALRTGNGAIIIGIAKIKNEKSL